LILIPTGYFFGISFILIMFFHYQLLICTTIIN